MYSDLDASSKRAISVSAFADAYRQAIRTSTAVSMRIAGRTRGLPGAIVEVPVRVQTRLFGALTLKYRLHIDEEGEAGPAIAWSRSLAFPGLRAGETLVSHISTPQRATPLARDGSVLAESPPGLEHALDERLRGRPGGALLEGARLLAYVPPHAASAVRTSISPTVQRAAVAALGGQYGGIVAMDPRTGEILAVAGIGLEGLQPPGSTFKIVTLTGVLEAGLADRRTVFPYATYATLDGVKLGNAHGESCGGSLELAFAVSCNSVFSPLGFKLGASRLVASAERLGFNRVPDPRNWCSSL